MSDRKAANRLLRELRVADLKLELERRGLPTAGIKAVLADRLYKHLKEQGKDPETFVFGQDDQDGEQVEEVEDQKQVDDEQEQKEEEEAQELLEGKGQECQDEPITQANVTKEGIEDQEQVGDEKKQKDEKVALATEETEGDEPNKGEKQKPTEEESINIMVGEEDINFDDAEFLEPTVPPPAAQLTSRDIIDMHSQTSAPSENSSMVVNTGDDSRLTSQEGEDALADKEATRSQADEESAKNKETPDHSRNVWFSHLPLDTKASDLRAACSAHGKVVICQVLTNARTAGTRRFGLVVMEAGEDAVACVKALNNSLLHDKTISVQLAKCDMSALKRAVAPPAQEESKESEPSKLDRDHYRHRHHRDHPRSSGERSGSRSGGRIGTYEGRHQRDISPLREDRPTRPGVLTFAQIKKERERKKKREEEWRRREYERRKAFEEEERRRRRDLDRRREVEEILFREREELRRERERLEREKAELVRFERERQRVERERLQREKEELERLRRQQVDLRRGVKRTADDYYDSDHRKRSNQEGNYDNRSRYDSSSYENRGYSDNRARTSGYDRRDHYGDRGGGRPRGGSHWSSSRGHHHWSGNSSSGASGSEPFSSYQGSSGDRFDAYKGMGQKKY